MGHCFKRTKMRLGMPNVKISCDQEVLTVIRSQRRLCHVYLGALIKGSPGKFLTCSSWIKTVQNLTFITQSQRDRESFADLRDYLVHIYYFGQRKR